LPVDEDLLKCSSFWDRECALLEYPKEKPLPMAKSVWSHQPDGFHLEYRYEKQIIKGDVGKELSKAFVAAGWKPPKETSKDWFKDEFCGGLSVPALRYGKAARMMKVSKSSLWRVIQLRRRVVFLRYVNSAVRLFPHWVPDYVDTDLKSEERIKFVSSGFSWHGTRLRDSTGARLRSTPFVDWADDYFGGLFDF
jgi:hypothetical protein